MKKHKGLFFFIFGILFYEIIFPILGDIANTIVGALQLVQGKQAVQMTKYQQEIQDFKDSLNEEPQQTFAMGFHVPSTSDEDEDWEDDE